MIITDWKIDHTWTADKTRGSSLSLEFSFYFCLFFCLQNFLRLCHFGWCLGIQSVKISLEAKIWKLKFRLSSFEERDNYPSCYVQSYIGLVIQNINQQTSPLLSQWQEQEAGFCSSENPGQKMSLTQARSELRAINFKCRDQNNYYWIGYCWCKKYKNLNWHHISVELVCNKIVIFLWKIYLWNKIMLR